MVGLNRIRGFYLLVALIVLGIGAFGALAERAEPAQEYPPGREPMALPLDYTTSFVHYATVDRIDGKSRNLYISPHALDALRAGDPLPERTFIVIETYFAETDAAGELIRDEQGRLIQERLDPDIHASEMRTTWQIEDRRTTAPGDWNFGAFTAGSGDVISKDINDCFSCHEAAAGRDFVFSLPMLNRYLQSGEVQYDFCLRPARAICR